MNILRWRRKSKNKLRPKTLLLFIFSLIMTTFAWFAYSKVLEPNLDLHILSWDMVYEINGEQQENPIGISIHTLYPAMPEKTITIDIKNNGETTVDIDYYVQSVSILGNTYTLIQEGGTIPEGVTNYIVLTDAFLETDETTGVQTVRGAITNDLTKFPFTIEIEHSAKVDPVSLNQDGEEVPGTGYLTITVNWIGDDDELDSEWGHKVGEYLDANPTATSVMTINLLIDAYQLEPVIDETTGEFVTTIEQEIVMPSTSDTTPYLPTGFVRVPGTTLDTGLVIKDSSGNEYVWVEVPRTEVFSSIGLDITDFSTENYTLIENALKNYSSDYRDRDSYLLSGFHYNVFGIADTIYETAKNTMLKSVYQNGGFYIGRYETGILESYRTSNSSSTSEVPVIQANAYPYNYVTISQARALASNMESGDNTTSLMFDVQWDLVLKYLSTKGVGQEELITDSTRLGNYYNNIFYVTNLKAKYSLNKGVNWSVAPYEKATESALYITTGANTTFSRQNIYDFAGNLTEWTFDVYYNGSTHVGGNGGDYQDTSNNVANYNGNFTTSTGYEQVGFRVTLY